MRYSEQINELAAALTKAQSQFLPALKDATNPHFRSNYADFTSIVNSTRPALIANDLAIIQGATCTQAGDWVLVTRLIHKSGQWSESDYPLLAKDSTPQAMGSATTYAKRYSYSAMVGAITDDDDDGNASSLPRNTAPVKAAAPVSKPKVNAFGLNEGQKKLLKSLAVGAGLTDKEQKELLMKVVGKPDAKDWTNEDFTAMTRELDKLVKAKEQVTTPSEFENFNG